MNGPVNVTEDQIVETILREIEIGQFTNANIIQAIYGNTELSRHRAGKLNTAEFDQFVESDIWPLLKELGVLRARTIPPLYVMSEEAKKPKKNPGEKKMTSENRDRTTPGIARTPQTPTTIQPRDEEIIEELIKERNPGGFRPGHALSTLSKRWNEFET